MKPFWASKTLWGLAVMLIARLQAFDVHIHAHGVEMVAFTLADALTWAGAALGVYGRLDAAEPLAIKESKQ